MNSRERRRCERCYAKRRAEKRAETVTSIVFYLVYSVLCAGTGFQLARLMERIG